MTWVLWGMGILAATLTAFYMCRAVFMTFFGDVPRLDDRPPVAAPRERGARHAACTRTTRTTTSTTTTRTSRSRAPAARVAARDDDPAPHPRALPRSSPVSSTPARSRCSASTSTSCRWITGSSPVFDEAAQGRARSPTHHDAALARVALDGRRVPRVRGRQLRRVLDVHREEGQARGDYMARDEARGRLQRLIFVVSAASSSAQRKEAFTLT